MFTKVATLISIFAALHNVSANITGFKVNNDGPVREGDSVCSRGVGEDYTYAIYFSFK